VGIYGLCNNSLPTLLKPANDPCTANDLQIGPQIIPGLEMIPSQKVRNGMDSMKSLWMDTYFLNYPR